MKLELYTIYDSKEEIYYQPFFLLNDAVALRQFGDMANEETSKISKHPGDYTLWHLGSYEDSSATLKPLKTKKCLAHANEHVYYDSSADLNKATQQSITELKKAFG
jgi:hypothetical protein